jgi:hypothetical protein
MPKFLTIKKCVFTWKLEHSCTKIDLVYFNLFMFLSPRVRYSRVLKTRFSLCYNSLIYMRGPIVVLGPIS